MTLTFQHITKAEAVKLAEEHVAQDRLISGAFYKNGTPNWKGCSVGCFVKTNKEPHKKLAELLGTTEEIECLRDFIFERSYSAFIRHHLDSVFAHFL